MRSKEDIIKALNFSVRYDVPLTLLSEDVAIILGMIDQATGTKILDDIDRGEEDGNDAESELYSKRW